MIEGDIVNSSPLRFSGITSGMDTQSMVAQLMRAESMRMTRLTSRRQLIQWRQEDIRSTMFRLNEFRTENTTHTVANSIVNPGNQAWNTMKASLTNTNSNGNTNGISVSASASAQQGSFDFKVVKMAQGDLVRGTQFNGTSSGAVGEGGRGNVDLDSSVLAFLGNQTNHFSGTVRIGNADIEIRVTDTIQEFMDNVNNSNAGVRMNFDKARGVFTMEATGVGADAVVRTGNDRLGLLRHMGLANIRNEQHTTSVSLTPAISLVGKNGSTALGDIFAMTPGENITMSIGGRSFTVNDATTLNQFLSEINHADSGVRAEFDFVNDRFNLRAAQPGGQLNIGADSSGILASLGVTSEVRAELLEANQMAIASVVSVTPLVDLSSATPTTTFGDLFSGMPTTGDGSVAVMRIGGRDITVTAATTLAEFNDMVNHPESSVRIDFNFANNRLDIRAAQPGGTIQIGAIGQDGFLVDTHGFFTMFGINEDVIANINVVNHNNSRDRIVRSAQNAVIEHGIDSDLGTITVEQSTNNFEINGININITSAASVGQTFNVNTERNVDEAMDMIREFVNNYNELIRHINSLHTTARPRAGNTSRGAFFEPLTDEQRNGMSEREIERWEEQARMGLLHRDRDIRGVHQQLRNAMFNPVILATETTYDVRGNPHTRVTDQISLFNVGITTVGLNGAPNDRLNGVLQIDEDRLRKALEEDPERVRQLFARNHVDADLPFAGRDIARQNANAPHLGLGFRLEELLNVTANSVNSPLRQRAGSSTGEDSTENIMTRQIRDYNRRIDEMQKHLIRRENHYFAMFARMEQAMAQSHAQMDSLFAFMAG